MVLETADYQAVMTAINKSFGVDDWRTDEATGIEIPPKGHSVTNAETSLNGFVIMSKAVDIFLAVNDNNRDIMASYRPKMAQLQGETIRLILSIGQKAGRPSEKNADSKTEFILNLY